MKRILITGGTGFIGSNLANYYSKNNEVIVFDNNRRGKISSLNKNKNIKFINGDITDNKKFDKACKNIDSVIHLAYINGTKFFYKYPDKILEIATKGITNVIDSCIRNNIKQLFLASSSEVYQNPKIIPTPEDIPLTIPDIHNPRYTYGGGKILTELYGIHYAKYFKKMIIFRPHNVYGPNMGNEHVIPQLIIKINKIKNSNKPLEILGDGKQTRSFIFIDDFVKSFDLIFKKGKHKNIYNIGNNDEIKIINLAKKIKLISGVSNNTKFISNHKGSPNRRCPDISKIRNLGYQMHYNINEGLNLTYEWYKSIK